MSGLLLDTCAVIYLALNRPMPAAVSAWEVGLLATRGRFVQAPAPDAIQRWFDVFLARSGVQTAEFTNAVAFDAVSLSGPANRDPIDRFLIATARLMALPLVTHDQVILDYAKRGHVRAIPC